MNSRLSPQENKVITCLRNKKGVVTHKELLRAINSVAVSPIAVLHILITRIREVMGYDYIVTYERVGYSLRENAVCPTCGKEF